MRRPGSSEAAVDPGGAEPVPGRDPRSVARVPRRGRGRCAGSQRGFTLVEMMVVILLIGVGFSYTIINIDHLVPSSRLEKAARDIGGMLTRMRQKAVFRGEEHFLEYDLDNHRFRVYRAATLSELDDGAPDLIVTTWFELPAKIRIENVQFSERDEHSSGLALVRFTPKGGVDGHLVHLVSDDILDEERKRFTVELNPITGLVTYTPGEKQYAQVRDEFEF